MPRSLLRLFALYTVILFTLTLPTPGDAQGWTLDISAGRSVNDPIPASVETTGLAVGLHHEGARWFFISAGAPLDSVGFPWGALGLGGRISTSVRQVGVGLDAGVQGFGYHDRISQAGGGITAAAMPLIALEGGAVQIEVRSGVLHHTSILADQVAGRGVHQTDLRVLWGTPQLEVVGESRYLRAAEGDYPYIGGAVEAEMERVALAAFGGVWVSELIETPAWGMEARFRFSRGTAVHVRLQQETNDPVFRNAPRRSWGLGFSHLLGRKSQLSAPVLAPVLSDGGIIFRLPVSGDASPPRLAGDFSGWQELPMVRTGSFWSIRVPLSSGVYRYAFRTAEGAWFVPESTLSREPDGFGGFNAVLVVP